MSITNSYPDSVDWVLEKTAFSGQGTKQIVDRTLSSWNNTRVHDGAVSNWKQRIRDLQSATTNLTGVKVRFSGRDNIFCERQLLCVSGPQTGQRQGFKMSGCSGAGMSYPPSTAMSLTVADREAITKFVSQATAAQQSLQGLTFIGELAEALRMIRRPGQELFKKQYKYLDDVRNAVKKTRPDRRKRDLAKTIGGTWLENAFGWQPLINDIKSGAEGLSRILTYTPPHKVVSGFGYASENTLSVTESTSLGSSVTMRRNFQDVRSASVRYRGCVAGVNPDFQGSLDTFGINASSLIPSLWELIPSSFLVDYFTNLGSVIAGCSFASGSVKWCVQSTRQVQRRTLLSTDFTRASIGGWVETDYSASPGGQPFAEKVTVLRHPYSSNFIPSFTVKIPGSSLKWLNIGALVATSKQTSRALASML